jgi:predicted porin
MQKKLIALAVAGLASTGAFAQSNVTIYGLLQPSYDFIDYEGGDNVTLLNHNNSRIGFKGEESLGNGLKAIFQLEAKAKFTVEGDDDSMFGSRDSFVGVESSLGSLTFGNHQTAYKKAADYLDPFADSIGDYNNLMGVISTGDDEFNNRHSGSLYYTSPSLSGFRLVASYAIGGTGQEDADGNDMSNGAANGTNFEKANDTYSVAGVYTAGGITVSLGYQENTRATSVADDISAWKIGGAYKFGNGATLGAAYEDIDGGTAGSADRWFIGGTFPVSSTVDLMASYTAASGDDTLGGDADAYALGASYKFSKRTSLQAYYAAVSNDSNAQFGFDADSSAAAAGEDVSGFSVRLRHSF